MEIKKQYGLKLRPSVIKRMKEGCKAEGRSQRVVFELMVENRFPKKGRGEK